MGSDHFPLLAVTIPFAGIVGVFVGSFLNVVIYRSPLGLSVASPRSFCPTCRRQLNWWENIPVASWVALRGRCHGCHQSVSPRYPLVELSTGAVFALVTWGWHGSVIAAGYCCLAATIIAVALIEYGGSRAPLGVAAIGTGLSQVLIVAGAGWHHQWRTVVGSLVGSATAFIVYLVMRVADPECVDARGHGRSALLVAGCWLGGLGVGPAIIGVAAWIGGYLACLIGTWSMTRQQPGLENAPTSVRRAHPVFGTPLVSALVLAMAASLIAGG